MSIAYVVNHEKEEHTRKLRGILLFAILVLIGKF